MSEADAEREAMAAMGSPWRHGWGIVRAYPGLFAINIAGYVAFYSLPLVTGLMGKLVFDTLHDAPAAPDLWTLVALAIFAQIAPQLILLGAFAVWIRFAYIMEAMMRRNMLAFLVSAPGPKSLPASAGDVVSRFRDDVMTVVWFVEAWVDISGLGVFTVVALTIMATIDWPVAAVAALPMIAVVVITNYLALRIHHYRRIARETTSKVTGFIGEIFGAVQAIQVASGEHRVLGHLQGLNDSRRKAAINDALFNSMLDTLSTNMGRIGLGLVLLMAAGAMRTGHFTVGDFALFVSYTSFASFGPQWVGRLMARRRTAGVSIARMEEVLEGAQPFALTAARATDPMAADRADPLQVLTARGLTSHYPGTTRGIEGIDLTLRRGGLIVIAGEVGAGKTTLIKALLGLVPLQAGEIRWNGHLVEDPASFMVPPRSAYTGQAPRLFSESVRENVLMGLPPEEADLDAAIHMAILEDDLAGMQDGLGTLVGTRGVSLSGGQLQRTAAARMLVRRPDLIVLDDASSALDVNTERLFWRRLLDQGERTCIAVSHRPDAYRRADEIILLSHGAVAARGTLAELLDTSPLFRQTWRDITHAADHTQPA
ncbi:MAG TPA: ABC transporter ATP-binding protein [Caulobacteraceae bacterium]|nr:ABC transporter ATP-binding protein [Caulobacteraceae bacterium]